MINSKVGECILRLLRPSTKAQDETLSEVEGLRRPRFAQSPRTDTSCRGGFNFPYLLNLQLPTCSRTINIKSSGPPAQRGLATFPNGFKSPTT